MEQSSENKIEFKDKFLRFFLHHKIKIYIFLIIFFTAISSLIYMENYNKKQNKLIAEKYIQAGLHLSSKDEENAILLFEEIILSKNNFYSILALNIIVEKNLITDKIRVLEYFKILEDSISSKDENDLIVFKKALYLIKNSEVEKGKNIMKNLIDQNSNLKSIVEEFLKK